MRLRIIIDAEVPDGMAQAAKESIAADIERYGDARVVSIQEIQAEQMRIGGIDGADRE